MLISIFQQGVAEAKLGSTLPPAYQHRQLQVLRPPAVTLELHKLPFLQQGQEIFIQGE
jgi:hypothetical protein